MCLGVPGKIVKINENRSMAMVDVCGVQREVNISLITQSDANLLMNKWVLVHVGFAMSILDEEEAQKTLDALLAMSELEHEVSDFLGLNNK
ncbi:hydrogenase maturation factor HybG [Pasteurella dagmatis]|uniref:Hydrogenase assembly chaperone HypC/HupF n=1 Tax=Pasteurella dagmatis ATCC 43325 TaxID=667128 RepID=C9PPV8_9PAST|nr:hydrogenase maturation factor HybG [Pasteurella dagmatis]EEX50409.1 hydrogenase assembly chaperone HypC/HupF [Pasteurella dagmatis ATCC 43325]SNV56290.1 Hydrogenase isoenzymes formation protein hypC [Pasteurella dagmatis]